MASPMWIYMYSNSMKMTYCAVFVTLYLCILSFACPDQCECRQRTVRCSRDDVPRQIPEDTEQVFIEKMDLDNLKPGVFKDSSWKTMSFLDISADRGQHLYNESFVGLENLTFLGMHAQHLWKTQPSAFEGLDNLETLDFSFNTWATFDMFWLAAFHVAKPKLRNLTVTEMNSHHFEAVNFNDETLKFCSECKNLKYLDISGLNIAIVDIGSLQKYLCNSVEHIKASRVSLGHITNERGNACSSLRTLDLSRAHLPNIKKGITNIDCLELPFIKHIETLIANGIIAFSFDMPYNNDLRHCNFDLREICFSNNNLRWINMTVNLSSTLERTISKIDLSNNIIEYLAPTFIYPSTQLETLNLTNNRLSIMQVEYRDTFEVLLKRSKKLKTIYLAYNMLQGIPNHFFIENEDLEIIDLSRNRLTSIKFIFQHLVKLKFLDLHGNLIHNLDETTRVMLNNFNTNTCLTSTSSNINSNKTTRHLNSNDTCVGNATSSQVYVNLGSNPFQCNCEKDSIHMVEWFETSVLIYRTSSTYTCAFDGQALDILNSAVTKVTAICDHKHLIRSLIIAIPSVAGSIAIGIMVALLFRRRQRRLKQYQGFLQDLKHDIFANKFLLFLSFCSEDTEFVLNNIAEPLQDKLSDITENNRNFICIGDYEFRLGLMVHEEVMRCMEECSVVMFIVSKTFCKKDWCNMEVKEAYNQQKPIIMFMRERVEPENMPKILLRMFNRYTHAAWIDDNNGGHCKPSIHKMCESILEMSSRRAIDGKKEKDGADNDAYEMNDL